MCGEGKNPPSVAAAPLVGPKKKRHIILCGLNCTYVGDSLTQYTVTLPLLSLRALSLESESCSFFAAEGSPRT
jgi:hypothetical protein